MTVDRRRYERRKGPDIRAVLHTLWTWAVGMPGYVKRTWNTLDGWVASLDRRRGRDRRS